MFCQPVPGDKIGSKIRNCVSRLLLAGAVALPLAGPVPIGGTATAEAQPANRGMSGLPLPRYVSLKSERVNMRVGPGREYQVEWMYLKRGLPMEIIQEYDNWRKVRDPEGNEGWILHSLLSGSRTVIVAPWDKERKYVEMRDEPSPGARIVARIQPTVVAPVSACTKGWCKLEVAGASGYVRQNQLWGVYPDETLDD